jgi:hypothetical protein
MSDGAVVATNDNWQSAPNASEIQAKGFVPYNPLESVILMTLPPGAYTAVLSNKNGATGEGVVSVNTVR